MIKSDELRAAEAVVKAHKREHKKQRSKPKPPKHKNAPTREHDNTFLQWIRRKACAVGPVGCSGRIDAAHVRKHRPGALPTGMGRKPDDLGNVNPLCRFHHDEQHADGNEIRWWASYGKDPHVSAEAYKDEYLEEMK